MPGEDADHPILRPTARAVLVAPPGKVLLFRLEFPAWERERPLWITPGGGVEAGESYGQAVLRELAEETGLDITLGPAVWRRTHCFAVNGRWLQLEERYFVAHTPEAKEPSRLAWTAQEAQVLKEARWWAADEIAAAPDHFVPARIATLLPPLLAGDYPAMPLDAGL